MRVLRSAPLGGIAGGLGVRVALSVLVAMRLLARLIGAQLSQAAPAGTGNTPVTGPPLGQIRPVTTSTRPAA